MNVIIYSFKYVISPKLCTLIFVTNNYLKNYLLKKTTVLKEFIGFRYNTILNFLMMQLLINIKIIRYEKL